MVIKHPQTHSNYEELTALAQQVSVIVNQAFNIFNPMVTEVIQGQCKSVHTIEHILDGLLSFCSDDRITTLYRDLCRYYMPLNPAATLDYIRIFRDMWNNPNESDE